MEVMKQLRQRAIRDLVEQRPDPDPAGARGRPARTRLPDDPGDDLPRRRRARAHQGDARRDRRLRPAAAAHRGRDVAARTGCASSSPTCRSRSTRPGLLLVAAHAARLGARDRGGPRPGALAGGRRARSPATTRCSWRSRTAARCSGSSAVCLRAPRRVALSGARAL